MFGVDFTLFYGLFQLNSYLIATAIPNIGPLWRGWGRPWHWVSSSPRRQQQLPSSAATEGDTGESLKFGQNTSKEKQQAVLQLLSNIAAWIDR